MAAHACSGLREHSGFIHISDGKLHDVHALDMLLPEAGSISAIDVVDECYRRGPPLCVDQAGGLGIVTHAKSNIDAHRVYSATTDRSTGITLRPDHRRTASQARGPASSAHLLQQDECSTTPVFITNNLVPAATICAPRKAAGRWNYFFKWITQHLRIKQFERRRTRFRPDLDRRFGQDPRCHRQEAPTNGRLAYTWLSSSR